MKKLPALIATSALLALAAPAASAQTIVATDAYAWTGDTIRQGEFRAYAPTPEQIVSTYSARPGYYMPVEKEWTRKNDLSAYPRLTTSNRLLQAVYNMGLDEMVNAVEPDTTLRTGKEWAGVWTRDVSYSIILSMAHMQPLASKISLMRKVNADGQIIQDTGSGGAWPISTDRLVWALAAWELYKVTGDREWLQYAYPIVVRSLQKDAATTVSDHGTLKGETSFIDWREQSYPRWMQTADIAASEAAGTNMVYAAAQRVAAQMAQALGLKKEAAEWTEKADATAKAVDARFWNDQKGLYDMYIYGRTFPIANPRAETLGESLAILYDIASPEKQRRITESNPVTPYGPAIFFPQIPDLPNYHNNALWPFVASYWALANAKAGNEAGTLEAIGSVVRPAALFATNKENFNLDNGDIYTELNSSNMLWSLSGNIALTNRILFGLHFEPDGIDFRPFVPQALADDRLLENISYRGATLAVSVSGAGTGVKSISLNGKPLKSTFIPAKMLKGDCRVDIVMDGQFQPMQVNRTPNVKAPLTPIAWLEEGWLRWNPIEYIAEYIVLRDGKPVATTRETRFDASQPGEYQVIGVSAEGVQSFASEPRSTRQAWRLQMPGESRTIASQEVAYQPAAPIAGYDGDGWVELDQTSSPVTLEFDAPEAGTYALHLRYANGNGPVNTENRAAIRSIEASDGQIRTVVMPQRGTANWNDWGASNVVTLQLQKGKNPISITFRPENRNMNLQSNHALVDALIIEKID